MPCYRLIVEKRKILLVASLFHPIDIGADRPSSAKRLKQILSTNTPKHFFQKPGIGPKVIAPEK